MNAKLVIKIAPKDTNIIGFYRECQDTTCNNLVPCPHVKCQDCRTDFAVKDWIVVGIDPETVEIRN